MASNETIDKLKKAGYITVTDDSQGIADKCDIQPGGSGSSIVDFISCANVSTAKPKYIYLSIESDPSGIVLSEPLDLDSYDNVYDLMDAVLHYPGKDYTFFSETQFPLVYTEEPSIGDVGVISLFGGTNISAGVVTSWQFSGFDFSMTDAEFDEVSTAILDGETVYTFIPRSEG